MTVFGDSVAMSDSHIELISVLIANLSAFLLSKLNPQKTYPEADIRIHLNVNHLLWGQFHKGLLSLIIATGI